MRAVRGTWGFLCLLLVAGCSEAPVASGPPPAFRYSLKRSDYVLAVTAGGVLNAATEWDITVPGNVGNSNIEYLAEEGSDVTSGADVLVVSTERLEKELRQARIQLAKKQAELEKQTRQHQVTEAERRDALEQKRRNLENACTQLAILEKGTDPDETGRTRLKIRSLEAETAEAARRLSTQEELRKKGFASQLDYEKARDGLSSKKLELAKQKNLLAKHLEGARQEERERLRLTVKKLEAEVSLADRALAEQLAVSKLELEKQRLEVDNREAALKEKQNAIAKCRIAAPLAGTVVHHDNSMFGGQRWAVGSPVWGGMRVLKIVQLGKLQASVAVSEQEIDRLKPGLRATLTARAAPGRSWPAKVAEISRVAKLREAEDPRAPKDFDVLLDVEGDTADLLPNLPVTAHIELARLTGVFRVPKDAVLGSRKLTPVAEDADYHYVRDGLTDGDWVPLR